MIFYLHLGGGWKVNLLKEELEKRKSEDGMMMFTDSYDVIFAASSESILGKTKSMNLQQLKIPFWKLSFSLTRV